MRGSNAHKLILEEYGIHYHGTYVPDHVVRESGRISSQYWRHG